jgi:threonine dehydrogenase-like Zn-dependent dehydrogenase
MMAIIQQGKPRLVEDQPVVNRRGEALVRVRLAGICSTDLELARGYMGFSGVLGHEFVGTVERAPDPGLLGRRVVGEINAACGRCDFCKKGLKNHCPRRTVLGIFKRDGSFAQYLSLPVENLHPVPETLPDEEAVFAEPLAAAFRVLEQVKIGPEERVFVLGDGKLGLLLAQVLRGTGCRLTVVGKHREKLKRLSAWGIEGVPARFIKMEKGIADIVVEATGSPEGFDLARSLLRPLGILVLKTTCAGRSSVDLAPIVVDELKVIGSRCGPFRPALEALASGSVRVRPLISEVFPLKDGVKALRYSEKKGIVKVLLRTD